MLQPAHCVAALCTSQQGLVSWGSVTVHTLFLLFGKAYAKKCWTGARNRLSKEIFDSVASPLLFSFKGRRSWHSRVQLSCGFWISTRAEWYANQLLQLFWQILQLRYESGFSENGNFCTSCSQKEYINDEIFAEISSVPKKRVPLCLGNMICLFSGHLCSTTMLH